MSDSPRVQLSAFWLSMVVALFVAAPAAEAQPEELPSSVLTSDTLSDSQLETIEEYVAAWANQLVSAENPQRIAEARKKLLAPIRNRLATNAVKDAVSSAAASRIQPAMERDSTVARMNALIVASELNDGAIADLCVSGLSGANPAVRYWAAKAVANVAGTGGEENPIFNADQQQQLLDALTGAMSEETSDSALRAMFRALSALTIPAAQDALLGVLEERVVLFVDGLSRGLQADQRALAELQRQLAVQEARGKTIDEPLRRLTRIAARYLRVAADQLQKGRVPKELTKVTRDLIDSVRQVFSFALDHFDSEYEANPQQLVQTFNQGAENDDFSLFKLEVLNWVGSKEDTGHLSDSDINIPRDQLTLPEKEGGEDAPDQDASDAEQPPDAVEA